VKILQEYGLKLQLRDNSKEASLETELGESKKGEFPLLSACVLIRNGRPKLL
jgi:hypothetical protein